MIHRENQKIWNELRKTVLLKYKEECVICEVPLGLEGMQLDHIIPLKDGGKPYDINNLQPLCCCCHIEKTQKENKARRLLQ